MDQHHTMRVFVAVAEHLSFAQAARALHMSRPAVTRAIASLEDKLGVELLVRTTRTVVLSQVGARYLEDCRRILEAVTEANAAASGSYTTPRGRLSITAPVMFGRLHVMPVIYDFLQEQPDVSVYALLLDRVVSLVNEGLDLGIRIGHLGDSTQMAIRVGEVHQIIIASPTYLAEHGTPHHPEQLKDHPLIAHTGTSRGLQWSFQGPTRIKIPVTPRLVTNDIQSTVDMVEKHLGLTRVLSYQAGAGLARGRLTRILNDWEPEPVPVHLVYPGGRRIPARTRAFLDHATQALRARADTGWQT